MHIALVSVEVSKLGGVERYAYNASKLLNPFVFTNKSEDANYVRHVPSIRWPDLLRKGIYPFLSTLLCRRSRFDIVHSMGVSHLFPHCITAHTSSKSMLKLLHKNKLFLRLSPLRRFYWNIRLLIPTLMERWLYRKNIPIISVSDMLKRRLIKEYCIPRYRIYVRYPGVDTEEFRPSQKLRDKTRNILGLEGIVFLFVGGQDKRKGLPNLIKALRDMKATLLICRGDCKDRSYNHPSGPNLFYLDKDTFSMSALYNACDLLVLPSHFDSFGFPVLEAMSCGCPVLVSKYVGAKEIVNNNAGLIIEDPDDVNEIREKIKLIVGDRKRLKDMGDEARRVAVRYDMVYFENSLINFYKSKVKCEMFNVLC